MRMSEHVFGGFALECVCFYVGGFVLVTVCERVSEETFLAADFSSFLKTLVRARKKLTSVSWIQMTSSLTTGMTHMLCRILAQMRYSPFSALLASMTLWQNRKPQKSHLSSWSRLTASVPGGYPRQDVVSRIFRLETVEHPFFSYTDVRGDQQLSPPGYQAPDVKASRCGNESQERYGRGKQVEGKWRKKEEEKFHCLDFIQVYESKYLNMVNHLPQVDNPCGILACIDKSKRYSTWCTLSWWQATHPSKL